MIEEKKIEEAAKKHMLEQFYSKDKAEYPIECGEIDRQCQNDFKEGINWFLDNLWHDGEEVPTEKNKHVLMYFESYSVWERECDFDEYYQLCNTGENGFDENTWKIFCDVGAWCSKWMYIDDILKGGK